MPEDSKPTIGPYRVIRRLGAGGMGEVLLAHDPRLDREVAIKRIRSDLAIDEERRARFQREARLAASLNHASIVQVFDLLTVDGIEHIVMEFVQGDSLRVALQDKGPLSLEHGLTVARQLAEGLSYAHQQGVVHRDLKTENVLLTPSGQAKISDFGIARRLLAGPDESRDVTITVPGNLLGTYRSMSPEQLCGDPVDSRSDLFSFGVLLYEAFTADSPFRATTHQATIQRVIHHRPPPVHSLSPDLPPGLSALIDHLLEKEPLLRPRDAEEVVERLAKATREIRSALSATAFSRTLTEAGESPPARSVRTLLITDLVASTELVNALGDRLAMAWSERHDRMARNLLNRYGGREIDKSDGFLLLFERPIEAVGWALDYHSALDRLSSELPSPMKARVGIHLGEVFLRKNPPEAVRHGAKPLEVEGLAKATAARLMSLAKGGRTLLTRGAFDLAYRAATDRESARSLSWQSHGSYRLKGVEEPVEVCEVGDHGDSPPKAPESVTKAFRVDQGPRIVKNYKLWSGIGLVIALALLFGRWLDQSRVVPTFDIAVLRPKIENQTANIDTDFLAFVLRSAMLRHLTSFERLSPRSSAEVDAVSGSPQQIARAVGADELLESNFACQDQNCLAELTRIEGESGGVLRNYRVEVPVDDPLTATRAIFVALEQLYNDVGASTGVTEIATTSDDYGAYIRIRRQLADRPGPRRLSQMLAEAESIRRRSPRFLDAHLLEAEVGSYLFFETRDPKILPATFERLAVADLIAPEDYFVHIIRARVEIQVGRLEAAAKTLDALEQSSPGSVQVLDTRAYLLEQLGEGAKALELFRSAIDRRPSWQRLFNHASLAHRLGKLDLARQSLDELLRLAPNNLRGMGLLAQIELESGDPKRASELYEQILIRSPSPIYNTNLGLARMLTREYAASAEAFALAVEAAPKNPVFVLNLADSRRLEGREDEALDLYRQVLSLLDDDPSRGPQQLTMRAQALAHLGEKRAAVAAIQEALQLAPGQGPIAFEAALVYALVGDFTAAIVNAEKAIELGRTGRWLSLPWFDGLRARPEFARLLAVGTDPD